MAAVGWFFLASSDLNFNFQILELELTIPSRCIFFRRLCLCFACLAFLSHLTSRKSQYEEAFIDSLQFKPHRNADDPTCKEMVITRLQCVHFLTTVYSPENSSLYFALSLPRVSSFEVVKLQPRPR